MDAPQFVSVRCFRSTRSSKPTVAWKRTGRRARSSYLREAVNRLESDSIAACYSRSPTKNLRIAPPRIARCLAPGWSWRQGRSLPLVAPRASSQIPEPIAHTVHGVDDAAAVATDEHLVQRLPRSNLLRCRERPCSVEIDVCQPCRKLLRWPPKITPGQGGNARVLEKASTHLHARAYPSSLQPLPQWREIGKQIESSFGRQNGNSRIRKALLHDSRQT